MPSFLSAIQPKFTRLFHDCLPSTSLCLPACLPSLLYMLASLLSIFSSFSPLYISFLPSSYTPVSLRSLLPSASLSLLVSVSPSFVPSTLLQFTRSSHVFRSCYRFTSLPALLPLYGSSSLPVFLPVCPSLARLPACRSCLPLYLFLPVCLPAIHPAFIYLCLLVCLLACLLLDVLTQLNPFVFFFSLLRLCSFFYLPYRTPILLFSPVFFLCYIHVGLLFCSSVISFS